MRLAGFYVPSLSNLSVMALVMQAVMMIAMPLIKVVQSRSDQPLDIKPEMEHVTIYDFIVCSFDA